MIKGIGGRRTGRIAALPAALAVLALAVATAQGDDSAPTLGLSTVEQRIVPASDDAGFRTLALGAGEEHIVREDGIGEAKPGREERRSSGVYFGQLSDFQLADEQSPARVEFLDFGPFSSAWRPYESLHAHLADAMVRQLNEFADASPVAAGDGSRRPMDLTINTGDAADNQQLNETIWARTLMEGGRVEPGSGISPFASGDLLCTALATLGLVADANEPHRYTGVQDYSDYLATPITAYYDPNQPLGAYAGWPRYQGLLDRAQEPFDAAGVDVPSYISFGNHDALAQGNQAANAAFEAVATGCLKPLVPLTLDTENLAEALGSLTLENLLGLFATDPTKLLFVPPDPERQYVSKKQYKDVFKQSTQEDGHGFAHVDPAEEAASNGAAGYYAWSPVPGYRFVSLDTVSVGGIVGISSSGNIDNPQFQWLRRELEAATEADELVVLFSHHAIPSLTADLPDEVAPPCLGIDDAHGHDVNPGCDLDPRSSTPIRLGGDMVALLHEFPHVIAWVAGHSHLNHVDPYPHPSGEGGFWSIRVAAEADWPQQSRLLEVFDNDDDTLSIFGTILDHAAPASAPPPGNASGFDLDELSSVGRILAYNDHQYGGRCGSGTCGEGHPEDRNVELLLADPRRGDGDDGNGDDGNGDNGDNGDDPRLGLRVKVERPQRSLRRVQALTTCVGSDCTARARGRLRVRFPGGRTRVFQLRRPVRELTAGKPAVINLGIRKPARRAARRALRQGGRVWARFRVRASADNLVRERVRRVRVLRV